MELIAILDDGVPERDDLDLPPVAVEVLEGTAALYQATGFSPPWIGYLAFEDGVCVGTCAFKERPDARGAEIAYFTFPGHEGRGVATRMAHELIVLAARTAPGLPLRAQTLPEENASTAVLRKLAFTLIGPVEHPEDGIVWEWQRAGERITQ